MSKCLAKAVKPRASCASLVLLTSSTLDLICVAIYVRLTLRGFWCKQSCGKPSKDICSGAVAACIRLCILCFIETSPCPEIKNIVVLPQLPPKPREPVQARKTRKPHPAPRAQKKPQRRSAFSASPATASQQPELQRKQRNKVMSPTPMSNINSPSTALAVPSQPRPSVVGYWCQNALPRP